MIKKASQFLLKGVISVGLISALLIWKVDGSELRQTFQSVDVPLFTLATLLFFFQNVIIAYCWQIVLVAQRNNVPFLRVLQVHFIGSFFGTFMPTSIGMDIVRAFSLSRYMRQGVDAMSSMFVTRVVGFLTNFAIALIVAFPVAEATGNLRILQVVAVMTVLFILAVWVLLHPQFLNGLGFILNRVGLQKIIAKIELFQNSSRALRHEKTSMYKLVSMSLGFQLLGSYIIYLVGLSLGITVAWYHYFIMVPLITAVTVLPLSIAGIGLRESAFVFFFVPLGATEAQAFSLSLLVFAQWITAALAGGVVYWLSGSMTENTRQQPEEAVADINKDHG